MARTKSRAVRRTGCVIEVQGARGISYRLKFDQPTGIKGERKTIYKTLRGVSREEAEAELAQLVGQAGRGADLDGGKQLLSTWIETWLEHHCDVSTRTRERYAQLLRGHVARALGHVRLDVLGPAHVEKLYGDLAKRLAPRTVNHCHRVLFQCLGDAKRLRIIPDNPASHVKRRRMKQSTDAPAMHVLPFDQFLVLLDHVKRADFKSAPYELVLLAFDSGARRGELLALRWSDLDPERRTIAISRAVDDTETYGVRIKSELKNASSRRSVALSVHTVAALRDRWKRQAENHLKCGARLPDDALIFPASINTPSDPFRPRAVTKSFALIVKQAGFQGFRFHDLRHSCASHLLEHGVPVPEVSRHLGHANSAITLSVYSHAVPKADGGTGLLDRLMPVPSAAE